MILKMRILGINIQPRRSMVDVNRALHKRFVDVVAHLGVKNAVLKTIMQGCRTKNVAGPLDVHKETNLQRTPKTPRDNGHFGVPRNSCYVVVEYLPGGALKSFHIKNRRKKLAFEVVLQLALDLARGCIQVVFCGLNYLHTKKIVHRDVKTENMLLDKNRTLKIADFGVARVEASNPSDMTGETGTLSYMAPEVRLVNI
ncbi:putative dual-specificity kinase TKL-Pl-4 family [Helianthus anomalus]